MKTHMQDRINYLFIIFCGIIIHGLLLLNDGIYWEDWLWISALRDNNWSIIYPVGFERGVPTDTYFFWFFSYIKNIEFAHRTVAFLSILFDAGLIYAICNKLRVLNKIDSLFVALISMIYPANHSQILLCTTNQLFYYMLFLGAVLFVFKSITARSFTKKIWRFASWVLFYISFSYGPLLMFFGGFIIILVLYLQDFKIYNFKRVLFNTVPRCIDYILLPFTYWAIKSIFFSIPLSGLYAGEYKFVASPERWFISLGKFVYNGIYGQFNTALVELISQPALWLFVLLGVLVWYTYFKGSAAHPSEASVTLAKPNSLFAYGLLLIGLGMFPYIAVGKGPSLTGWESRHSLLLALPIALMIVALARFLFHYPQKGYSLPGWFFFSTLLIAFGLTTISSYIGWQARWVKDRSVMLNLARLDGAKEYSVYWINDQYPLGGESTLSGENNYRFYEWSSIFENIWGDETRFGYDRRDPNPELLKEHTKFFTKRHNLSNCDPAGRQATLTIRRGTLTGSVFSLVGQYYYYKFLRPQRMEEFLIKVAEIQVLSLSSQL